MIVALIGCDQKQQTVAAATPKTAVPSSPQQQPDVGGKLTGRVLETMNAAGYTYVRVETAAGERWVAVRETKVEKGATVTIDSEMLARDFESKSLGRKFDAIVFGSMSGAAPHMTGGAAVDHVKVEKATGGKTIAEVWSARHELQDKPVVVRGTVVKFLPEIMGKNWIHIRDGSGQRDKGTDDITVTTTDVARAGDVVTVSGTLRVDKDFGSGYRYGVIVEEATLRK